MCPAVEPEMPVRVTNVSLPCALLSSQWVSCEQKQQAGRQGLEPSGRLGLYDSCMGLIEQNWIVKITLETDKTSVPMMANKLNKLDFTNSKYLMDVFY